MNLGYGKLFKLNLWHWTKLAILVFPLVPALGAVGIAVSILTVIKTKPGLVAKSPLTPIVSIWAVLLGISAAHGVYSREAWLGLSNIVPFFLLLVTFSVLICGVEQLRELAWCLVLPSGVILALGLGQLYGNWSLPDWFGWELIPLGNPTGRMSSVFSYANTLAIYLVIVFCLSLGLWTENFYHWRQTKSLKYLPWLTILLLTQGLGIILTSSRNAWVIAFLMTMIYALILGWRLLVLSINGLGLALVWAALGPDLGRQFLRNLIPSYFWARIGDQMYSDRPIATLRITQWQFCWDLFWERPWWGWGLRNFTPLYYQQMDIWLGHPHNLFLMFLGETGILNTLILVGLCGGIVIMNLRLLSYPSREVIIPLTYVLAFLACTLFNCFDVSLFDLRVNTMGWILLSALASTAKSP